ncbi:4'-phosphopantetheinyl transferase [Crocosphaera subtropica ATCC 51142]|uniref:4'-phosphopantetheinyl transferase n=1 Tax=Crocosphaera subtropica (strain ATCC 51142 / BH68) TaxID=43989 RepID=B1WSA9_CROS5|nr:4'-phosphopantetheinyl transferase superfamily protein [Crocosphaera subtropica]ACB51895.1 4'-phosphopantetheinyl transferase [Crocosphaera subtropica ATCC 51142]
MNIIWKSPSKHLTINPQEVHIWKTNLEQLSIDFQNSFNLLNEEEKIKAQRFHFEKHQKRFTLARSSLKKILSFYLSISPQDIKFQYSDYGKPKIIDKINLINLQFNVSHSEDIAIYGVTCDYFIGVDVEYIRPMPEAENLAKRFFSQKEYQQIRGLSSEEKNREFFKLWTGKEAYLKAIGKGIGGGLEKVEISTHKPIKFINLPECNNINYNLLYLTPHDNYLAAIAVEENEQTYHYWQLN